MGQLIRNTADGRRADVLTARLIEKGLAIAERDGLSSAAVFLEERHVDRFVIARVLGRRDATRIADGPKDGRVDEMGAAAVDAGVSMLGSHSPEFVAAYMAQRAVPHDVIERVITDLRPRREPK